MSDLGDRERGLFRDWAVRKHWVFGEKPENGGAATVERPEAPEEEPPAAPEQAKPPPGPASAPPPAQPAAAASQPAAAQTRPTPMAPPGPVAASHAAGWDPEPVGRPAGAAPQRAASGAPAPAPAPAAQLSHVTERGEARMVDVSAKADTEREAVAEGYVTMQSSTLSLILGGALAKGDVLAVARVAGIMAAKRTSDLIPMCHPLPITGVTIDLSPSGEGRLHIRATVRTTGKTGVEMEALTAVSVTALAVYDMAKAVDRGMRVEGIRLLSKTGGKSGDWQTQ